MIKAVIFDLDNTLLDFVTMKREAVKNALSSMIEAGLDIDSKTSYKRIMQLYEENGWERNQYVFNKFLREVDGRLNYKYLAAGIVAYRRAKDKHLKLYPNVEKTLNEISNKGIKLAIVSDAPSREAWMRICYLKLHNIFDVVIAFDDSKERKPSSAPFKLALGKLRLSNDEVLMVGDWPERDIKGAANLGMTTAFAKYGSTQNIIDAGANFDLNKISDLIGIVKKINN